MKRENLSWQLPPEIEARLGEGSYGRQRAMFEANHLLIILHNPPESDEPAPQEVAFLRKPDGQYQCDGLDNGEDRLRELLAAYRDRWGECDKQYETAETASELFNLLERLAPLNRASTNMASALQSARECVKEDKLLISLRDEGYEISRSFDLLLADAKLKLDYRMAQHAEAQAGKTDEMTRAQHKLNLLAAITFPLMAVATLLGMNLIHGMENATPFLFWGVLLLGVGIGIVVRNWVIKK